MSENTDPKPSRNSSGTERAFAHLVPGHLCGNGRYELKRQIGRGGMGVVWQAEDLRLHETVALKFLPPEIQNDPVALDDMRRETLKSHKLSHPHIVRIHDLFESEHESPFISMEFIDGANLGDLRRQRPEQCFPWHQLMPLVSQLCGALEYAHGEGVIHRDLKPANLMLDPRGRLKLADFGIASVISESVSRITHRHARSGTINYMSPQQIEGERPHASDDIYALGATLYELLSTRPPFYEGDITHQVLRTAPSPLPVRLVEFGLSNEVPPEVAALILACLGKDPGQRPQSGRLVADWIGLADAGNAAGQSCSPAAAANDDVDGSHSGRGTQRRRIPLSVAAGILGLACLAGAYWWWQVSHPPSPVFDDEVVAAEPPATESVATPPVNEVPVPGPTNAAAHTNSLERPATPRLAKAAPAPVAATVFENADFIVSGTGFQTAILNDRAKAFSNRPYSWRGVPAEVKGWTFTRIGGGQKQTIHVRAKRNAILVGVISSAESAQPPSGWAPVASRAADFGYNDGKRTQVYLVQRALIRGQDLDIVAGNWMGTLLLFRK